MTKYSQSIFGKQLSIKEKDILEHALGLNYGNVPYRNYFSTDIQYSEYQEELDRLVADGLMYRGTFSEHLQFYHVTEKGKLSVMPIKFKEPKLIPCPHCDGTGEIEEDD